MPQRRLHQALAAAAIVLSFWAQGARAAGPALIEAARKEGRVVWYTTQIINQFARPAAEAFEKKYGVKVDYVRTDSNDVALRMLNEGRAGRVQADVFDGTSAAARLRKENLVAQWAPDTGGRLPANAIDPGGYWIATNLYVLTPGINTDLVPKGSEPRTFDDLLNPKWNGRIAWNSSATPSGAGGFIGTVLTEMGEDNGRAYLKKLAGQDIAGLQTAARQVLDQVIAGEYAMALNIFNNHAVISANKGAPAAWIAMSPAMTIFSVVSLAKDAPHPNAGKLLIEFLVSEEGQKLYRDADYMPIDPAVAPREPALRPDGGKFRAAAFTPEEIEMRMPKWSAIYKELFR